MSKNTLTRRRFIAGMAGAVTCSLGRQVYGEELPTLSSDDPMAIALAYAADAKDVDTGKNPTYKPGNDCSNCLQFKDVDSEGFGKCALFPGKKVRSKAWCKAWVSG